MDTKKVGVAILELFLFAVWLVILCSDLLHHLSHKRIATIFSDGLDNEIPFVL